MCFTGSLSLSLHCRGAKGEEFTAYLEQKGTLSPRVEPVFLMTVNNHKGGTKSRPLSFSELENAKSQFLVQARDLWQQRTAEEAFMLGRGVVLITTKWVADC